MAAVFLLLFTALVACVDPDAPMDPTNTSEFVFEVPKGSTAYGVGPALVEQGLVPSEFQWKRFVKSEDASCLKAGKFSVSPSMSMRNILETLCGLPLPDDIPFTVVEGWRIRDIDEALAKAKLIQPGEYKTLAESKGAESPFEVPSPTLEGYLWPETYKVSPTAFSAKKFIERQLTMFNERFMEAHAKDVEKRGLHGVVVMASLLEREEPKPENRPLVAGILWKRLDRGWQLGVDATSRYQLVNWNDRKGFLAHLRDPEDPYNTRIHHGLPPTAIGNPTLSSLEAALNPKSSDFWFYLHDKNQNLHPARNGDEHDANRAKYDIY
ncbi:MAG: endolytic transglycosylase MltG [Proteobacteria bacterium]|jgi:UPF0755 protein|nr:endolytic transglycosylase MltG [Pseudomonadota bacterium]